MNILSQLIKLANNVYDKSTSLSCIFTAKQQIPHKFDVRPSSRPIFLREYIPLTKIIKLK